MSNKNYTICEYQWISISKDGESKETGIDGIAIPKQEFEALENFILDNDNPFLTITKKPSYGKVLQAKQYVGTIKTKKGLSIEILPKIAKGQEEKGKSREILIKMLKHLKDSPFKQFNLADLKTQKMYLFEVYIHMFCKEVDTLLRKGLKSDYIEHEDNLNFLKGKIIFSQHLKNNLSNESRFYVSYDEYSQNRPENRLIKKTLEHLATLSTDFSNQQIIRQLIFAMDEIESSSDVRRDFNKCKTNRLMNDYSNIILWCKLFLNNESFVSFAGSSIAFAILFDMNKVFENYVAYCLSKDYKITTQDKSKSLIVKPDEQFGLKPDIVLFGNNESIKYILDTKWKVINEFKKISQSDVYQMYAYVTKYPDCNDVVLIYPKTEESKEFNPQFFDEKRKLHVNYFDLEKQEFLFTFPYKPKTI